MLDCLLVRSLVCRWVRFVLVFVWFLSTCCVGGHSVLGDFGMFPR